jgi:2-oxoglutarate dehydrogenase E2 component (dihydrolipoamide succinyltransferase)
MEIIMPKMGESVNEGTIIKWHKKKGDHVKQDEIIFEISTDKIDTEIPSPAEGILSEILAGEGETVQVGTVVAIIESNGNATSIKESSQAGTKKSKTSVEDAPPTPQPEKVEEEKMASPLKAEKNPAESSEEYISIVEVPMPKMGESIMEGTIIKWHKKVGEAIKKDETLFEISTDKVDTEVPSPVEGVLKEVLVGEQETVEVGTIVAKISSLLKQEAAGKPGEKVYAEVEETKTAAAMPGVIQDDYFGLKVKPLTKKETHTTRFYSPLVLNIAQKENVSLDELHNIEGSGLEGRVTKKDILSYIENRGKTKLAEPDISERKVERKEFKQSFVYETIEPEEMTGEIEKIPMDNIRQKIMNHMINSRDTSVHVSAVIEVDMTKIQNFLNAKRDDYLKKEGVKLTYLSFIAHAAVKALKQYPLVNSSIEGTNILKKKFVNLGIAVALEPDGLIVPNIKRADEKNLIGIAKAINDLAERARNKKLVPDDITNGTFTITNYGVFGTTFGTPIINQPEVAILGVGAVIKRPIVVEVDQMDTIAIKPMMSLTLTHDHRLVDGMVGGRFLKAVKDTLEKFEEEMI